MAKRKKNWWAWLAELIEEQGPLRYQGTYDAGNPYYQDNRVRFKPVDPEAEAVTYQSRPPEEMAAERAEAARQQATQGEAPVRLDPDQQFRYDFWRQNELEKLKGRKQAEGAAGGIANLGVKRRGYEDKSPRGEMYSDSWWYDMTRMYDKWSPELQQKWKEDFGRPKYGDPYQVFPYWKYDKPQSVSYGGKGKMFNWNRRIPEGNRGMVRDKWGRWTWPDEQPAELSENRIGNQMVTWRR